MFRIIVAVGLSGIAAITWIAYHMADRRIPVCGDYMDDNYRACVIRGEAARDATVTYGLIAAPIVILASLIGYAILRARFRRHNRSELRLP